jgi:hypothetical protein
MPGRVNPGARALNVVLSTKPKRLPGWRQKGTGAGTGSRYSPVRDTQRARRSESPSPMRVNRVERGKPLSLLPEGKEVSRPTDGGAGKGGGKSEGRPGMGRRRVATSPDAHAG